MSINTKTLARTVTHQLDELKARITGTRSVCAGLRPDIAEFRNSTVLALDALDTLICTIISAEEVGIRQPEDVVIRVNSMIKEVNDLTNELVAMETLITRRGNNTLN